MPGPRSIEEEEERYKKVNNTGPGITVETANKNKKDKESSMPLNVVKKDNGTLGGGKSGGSGTSSKGSVKPLVTGGNGGTTTTTTSNNTNQQKTPTTNAIKKEDNTKAPEKIPDIKKTPEQQEQQKKDDKKSEAVTGGVIKKLDFSKVKIDNLPQEFTLDSNSSQFQKKLNDNYDKEKQIEKQIEDQKKEEIRKKNAEQEESNKYKEQYNNIWGSGEGSSDINDVNNNGSGSGNRNGDGDGEDDTLYRAIDSRIKASINKTSDKYVPPKRKNRDVTENPGAPQNSKLITDLSLINQDINEKIPHFNSKHLINKKPFFIKSYSAFERLTPFIRCYVIIKDFKDDSRVRSNLVKTFFDIPYNMIKTLSVEYEGGFGVTGVFNLKLDDTTGMIGNVITSYFYLLGYTQDPSNVPKIHLQFGWAINGLKKLNSKDYKKIYYINHFSEFSVLKFDVEYTENFKQEITLSGRQEKTGIDSLLNMPNNPYTPYSYLGENPVENFSLLLHHHHFTVYKKKNIDLISDYITSNNIKRSLSSDEKTIIGKFCNLSFTTDHKKIKKTELDTNVNIKDMNSIVKPNYFLNGFSFHEQKNVEIANQMKGIISNYTSKSKITHYMMLCYFLNIYFNEVLYDIEKYEKENVNPAFIPLKNYLLLFCDENKLLRFGLNETPRTFTEYCIKETFATNNKKKNLKLSLLSNDTFKITKNDTWGGLFERMCEQIFFLNDSNTHLYISYNKYVNTPASFSDFSDKDKSEGLLLKNKTTLINTFNTLKEQIKEREAAFIKKNPGTPTNNPTRTGYTNYVKELQNKIQEIEKIENDFRYFIITYGTDFISENNKDDILILQKYTVFPKINSSYNLNNQIFFSGKNSLQDASFPDVIYFKPKIDFLKKIASFTNTVNSKEFHQGYISYRGDEFLTVNDNISIEANIKDKLDGIINKLSTINSYESPFSLKLTRSGDYYNIDGVDFKGTAINDLWKVMSPVRGNTSSKQISLEATPNRSTYQAQIIAVYSLMKHIKDYISKISTNYNFKQMDYLFKKTINVTSGDNSQSSYYSFSTLVDSFNYELAKENTPFEAELKILGEPAFTYISGAAPCIYVEVNNSDGSKNNFLSGPYVITKLKHDIDTSGGFTTTLTLNFIPTSDIKNGISNRKPASDLSGPTPIA
jgi:hypothetical protein